MAKTQTPPTIPFVEGYFKGGKQRPTAIVLRSSHNTPEVGAALGMANYWHTPRSPRDISHYIVDERQIVQTVPDNIIAGERGCQDRGALRITLCAEPMTDAEFWDDSKHSEVLVRASKLVAELISVHRIAPRYLDQDQARRWSRHPFRHRGGLIVDIQGAFPRTEFLDDVNFHLLKRKR